MPENGSKAWELTGLKTAANFYKYLNYYFFIRQCSCILNTVTAYMNLQKLTQ